MTRLTIRDVTGGSEEYTVPEDVASGAVLALSQQLPAHPLYVDDTTVRHLNMRQVVSVDVTREPEQDVPPQEDVSEADEPAEDTRTVAQLKDALDAAKVEYDPKALKADLLELAKTNGV